MTLFEEQPGTTFLDGVRCTGDESRLIDCLVSSRYEELSCESYAGAICGRSNQVSVYFCFPAQIFKLLLNH